MNDEALTRLFRALFLADLEAGLPRSLEGYLQLFPGSEDLIRGLHARLSLDEGPSAAAAPPPPEGVVASSEAAPQLPSHIGAYRLIDEIGRGGQAVVWRAADERLGRTIAIKLLVRTGPGCESTIARFRREAEITSRLEHPGICPVHDAGVAQGLPYIVMPLLDGVPLSQRISSSRPVAEDAFFATTETAGEESDPAPAHAGEAPPPKGLPGRDEIDGILVLFEKVCRALHAAHEHEVIHRDIKPANIMVQRSGEPIILDFGLAQNEDESHLTLTQTGDFFGTPAYMSPEQISAHRIRLDRRTDVYSLAVSLYEALTLRRPFEASARDALYQAILTKDPIDPRRINKAVSRDLAVVTLTAMEKDRDRRYRSAADFGDELRRLRERLPILARPAGPALRLMRWCQRHRGVAAMIVVAILLTTATFVGSRIAAARRERRVEEERMQQVQEDMRRSLDEFREAFAKGASSLLVSNGMALATAQSIQAAGAEGRRRFEELFASSDPQEQAMAVYLAMSSRSEPWMIDRLAHLVESGADIGLRAIASNCLMRVRDPAAIEILRRLHDGTSEEPIRVNTLFGLCQLGDPEAIQEAAAYVRDEESRYRGPFIQGYVLLGGEIHRPVMDEIIRLVLKRPKEKEGLKELLGFYEKLPAERRGEIPSLVAADETLDEETRERARALLPASGGS